MPKPVDRTKSVPAIAAALLTAVLAAAAPAQELVNRVVIRVNDRIATLHDYQERVAERVEQISLTDRPLADRRGAIAEAPEQVYNEMLQELLLLSRADQAGIVYTEDEIDAQVVRIRESYGIESDEQFSQALASQRLDERGFREQVVTGMRIQDLLGREVRSQLDVGEELARAFYRDHPEVFMAPQRLRLRELVVLDDSALAADERLALAQSLRDDLAAGDGVVEARLGSLEAGTVSSLIDLGWVTGGDLAPEIQAAVWELQPGAVSAPTEGRGGLHVVQVLEREEERLRPFAEVAEEAENRAGGIAFNEAMREYMQKLERQSYVDLAPPPEAADFRSTTPEALPALAQPAAGAETEAELEAEAAAAPDPEGDSASSAPPPEDITPPPTEPTDGP